MKLMCERCKKAPATLTSKGPMIWYPNGVGLWRPEKDVCMECAKLPTHILWPITHPRDCRLNSESRRSR
jgi:hypothetical protein